MTFPDFLRNHHFHLDFSLAVRAQQIFNDTFHQRINSTQHNPAVVITVAIRGNSSEKLYQELGLESLRSRS